MNKRNERKNSEFMCRATKVARPTWDYKTQHLKIIRRNYNRTYCTLHVPLQKI